LTKGRFFTPEFSASDSNNVVINSLAVSALSLDDPIGSRMLVDDELFTIIGIVDDFQVVPPIFEDLPLIIAKAKEKQEFLLVRVAPDQRPEAHAHIKKVLQAVNHEYPVDIRYYYDLTADMARTYYATAIMLNVFTAIIIFNAMMGLFGLSFFVAQRKNKEVGIRKVFGATVSEILWKLSKSFIWRLLIAFFIASPLIYVIGTSYVQFFTNHISIGPDIFLTGGVLALLMLLIAAGWKIYMAAVANPVSTLKYE
jgi:ABC-type antimicrobial peptide transport system permease subunit